MKFRGSDIGKKGFCSSKTAVDTSEKDFNKKLIFDKFAYGKINKTILSIHRLKKQ